jgi:hypothetical protein
MSTSHPGLRDGHPWSPGSRVGRLAVALGAGAVGALVLLAVGFALGVVEHADSFTDSWLLLVWGLVIVGSGAASAVTGALAIRRHDRAWSVLLSALFGLLVTLTMLREVAQGLFS